MSSSCDIVIERQSSQRNSPTNSSSSQAITPSMKIPINQYNSAHPYLNNNNRHFTALAAAAQETNSNHNVNSNYTNPLVGQALSPSANSDNQLHFGSPFQNFYKLPNALTNVSPNIRNSQFKEKTLQGALSKKRISAFLPVEKIVQNEQEISDNDAVQEIFKENFTHDGHIDDTIRVLSFHPNFLIEHVKFNNYLMYCQGALPYESRHYLAIMAASRHKCLFLVHQQELEFTSQKGNKSWLMGFENIPQKLKDINEVNKLICHQPWLINSSHIEKLLKNPYNSWSITELMMAVTILTHFHAMSGFVFGCGVEESYVQELVIKKQMELEENIRLERDRLAQLVNKENQRKLNVRNRKNHQQYDSSIKYNHMNSNETDSEDGEDFEDEDFEDDDELVDDGQHEDDDSDLKDTEQYLYNRTYYTGGNGQGIMFRDRSRSTSTGTVNRTLSNSSASSFEIGIDSLLKEMQVIQADDKHQKEHIFIKSNDIDLPSVAPNQLLLKNTSGSNTLTNSPSSSLVSTGSHYLSDLSNCNKTLPINHQKINWPVNLANNFNDAHDENTDDQNIDVDEDSDLESDLNTHLDQDQDVKAAGNRQHNKHFKKHYHHSRSASISSRNKNHQNHLSTSAHSSETSAQVNKGYVLKYVQDPEFGRLNFKNADQSLKLEYYTWENQGYRVTNSFYSDIATFLDKNFRIASQMTYNTLGQHKQVDTSVFRRAVWIYIHSLFGIRYDDYDYNQIKQLLGTPLRRYIKIVCSCPERVTKKDYDNILKEITHSEKVHINIVIMEARVQASLLYFLRAINSYFSDL